MAEEATFLKNIFLKTKKIASSATAEEAPFFIASSAVAEEATFLFF